MYSFFSPFPVASRYAFWLETGWALSQMTFDIITFGYISAILIVLAELERRQNIRALQGGVQFSDYFMSWHWADVNTGWFRCSRFRRGGEDESVSLYVCRAVLRRDEVQTKAERRTGRGWRHCRCLPWAFTALSSLLLGRGRNLRRGLLL